MRVKGPSLLIFSLASLISASALADGPRLGVVDVQRVMESAPEWVKAVDDLKREFDKKKSKLEADQESLKKKKEQLDAKRTLGDPKKIADEEAALLDEAKKFSQAFMMAQQDISKQEAGLKDAMLARIERLVMQTAEEGDYAYIFEAGTPGSPNVLYAAKGLDLTDKIVDSYKKNFANKPLEVPKNVPQRAGTPQGPQVP